MKNCTKTVCAILAILVLVSVAACSNNSNPIQSDGGNNASSSVPDGPGTDAKTPLMEQSLPLTTDPNAELSVFIAFYDANVDDLNDCENIKYLQEVTGVKINWVTVSDNDSSQRWQLLPVSNNLPDIIYTINGVMHDIDTAIDDGWLLDMSEYIRLYMPNYRLYLDTHDRVRETMTSIDGNIKMAATFLGNDEGPLMEWQTIGLCIREDLIKQAGYTGQLETVSDYYEMLTKVKEHFPGMTSPLYTNFSYIWAGSFMQPYNAYPALYTENGAVKYGPAEPGYGAWLDEMRKWYSEGLIEPNFDSVGVIDGLQAPATIISSDMTVLFSGAFSRTGTVMPVAYGLTQNRNIRITPVKSPVMNRGDTPLIYWAEPQDYSVLGSIHLSADCKNPELAAKWLDFVQTEQGMRILYYGKEGVHYTIDDSPDAAFRYIYTEAYDTLEERRGKIGSPSVGWYNWASGYQMVRTDIENTIAATGIQTDDSYETVMAAVHLWSDQEAGNFLKEIKYTTEQQRLVEIIATDITTYAEEYMVKYIKGMTDQSFDDYLSVLYDSLQLGKFLEIAQQAYELYG